MPFSVKLLTKFDDPDFILSLARKMTMHLGEEFSESGLNPESGATLRALSYIGEPERTSEGWHIGVGSGDAMGDPSTPAPHDTLRRFYNYLYGTGRVHRYTNWWGMSRANKRLLAQARRAGLFGGRGIDYANYAWVQNRGSSAAGIRARHFIESGISAWRSNVDAYVRDWEREHRA